MSTSIPRTGDTRDYPYRGYPLFKSKQFKSTHLNSTNQIKSNVSFRVEGRTVVPREKPVEQSREPTNSAHI